MKQKRKTEQANIERHRLTIRALGFISAFALVLAVFAWTTFDYAYYQTLRYHDSSLVDEILPDIVFEKKLPKPKPPKAMALVINPDPKPDPDPDPDPDFDPDPDDDSGFDYIEIDGGEDYGEYDESFEDDLPFIMVEHMPALGEDCATLRGEERKQCTERAIISFFGKRVRYPERLRDARMEDTVYLSFVVNSKGEAVDLEIKRTSHRMFGEEVLRVARMLPRFEPGRQQGRPVSVQYNIPIRFSLR
jgi:protein TonB